MEKKYKLIKEYPGSPALGTIEVRETYKGRVITNHTSFMYDIYPEFWEEIVEKKDYDNVCFEVCNHLYRITKNKKASTSEYSIEKYQHGKIERANWDWNNIDENFKTRIWKEVPLEQYMLQFKRKLFTTEDGVDIFAGDSYCFVNKCTLSHVNKNNVANDISGGNNISFVYFSTEQKAKEYIEMNKPIYSKEQVIKILRGVDDELNQYNDSDENYIEFIRKYK